MVGRRQALLRYDPQLAIQGGDSVADRGAIEDCCRVLRTGVNAGLG